MNDIPIKLCECGCGNRTIPAPRTVSSRGIVKGEPLRFLHGHNRRKSAAEYLIDPITGCWIWQRAIAYSRKGYGVSYDGKRPMDAHRVMYERHKGPIPEGLHIDHLCRNPPCVNPDHLEAVPQAENSRRGAVAKLTWSDIHAIRASSDLGIDLAVRFGVSAAQISRIRLNQVWRDS